MAQKPLLCFTLRESEQKTPTGPRSTTIVGVITPLKLSWTEIFRVITPVIPNLLKFFWDMTLPRVGFQFLFSGHDFLVAELKTKEKSGISTSLIPSQRPSKWRVTTPINPRSTIELLVMTPLKDIKGGEVWPLRCKTGFLENVPDFASFAGI